MQTTRTRRGAGLIAAGALVAGALAALPVSAAQAAETSTDYACAYTGGPYDTKLVLDVDGPAQVTQGQPVTLTADASIAWGTSWSDYGRSLNFQFKGVTATATVLVNGVALAQRATLTFNDADLAVPAAGNQTWPAASVSLPPIPTTSGADVAVTLGKVDVSGMIALTYTGGNFVPLALPCTVTGTAPTVASVDVLPMPALAPAVALKSAGKVAVGQRLTASGGTTTPASTVAYRWAVGGRAAGTGTAYVVKPADLGKVVTVTSTATKAGYTSLSKTITVGKVAAGTFAVSGKVKVVGKAKVGKKLTARPGAAAGAKVSYQWLKNGKAIKGAKGKTLKLKKSFKGKKISVRVTYTKVGYKAVVQTSKAVKVKK
ncbi:hypothetical protein [Mumia sp. DW29H23]|uniref:hypothetical protein n=1 Tax=Mumia sp. DW29H23 TaxID=3421241 RepID=UPI003D698DB8